MTFQLTGHELSTLASDMGFLKNPLEKVLRLVNVLKELEKNPVTKGKFVLKGGTALNLFFRELPRISVDIDVNYVGSLSKQKMQKEREIINSEILKIFSGEYEIEILKDEHALSQYVFRYKTSSDSMDALRLEINYLLRQSILEPEPRDLNRFDIKCRFPCLNETEILASKTIACISRYSPRDLYDLYEWIGSSPKYDKLKFLYLLLYFGLVARKSIFDLYELNLDSITYKQIRDHLLPMLQRAIIPQREEMIKAVQDFLKPLIMLTDTEEKAIKSFYATGELDADFLFPEKIMRQNILQSPALAWKIKNIKQHVS